MDTARNLTLDFFQNILKIHVAEEEILVAHQLGDNKSPIVVKCHPKLTQRALKNTKNLKDLQNAEDKPCYVNRQVPEHVLAKKKNISHAIRKVKVQNAGKPIGQRPKIALKKNKLFVNDNLVESAIQPPEVKDLFPDKTEQDKMNKIKLIYSEPIKEQGIIFTAITAKVSSIVEVKRAYRRVKQLHSNATHIPMAYGCQKKQGNADDDEHSASLCIQKIIESNNVGNRVVFVVHNYGGRRLEAKRFHIVEDLTKQVLMKIK